MLIYQLSKSTDNIERHWGAAKHKAEVDKRQKRQERHNTVEAGGEAQHRRGRRDITQKKQERHKTVEAGEALHKYTGEAGEALPTVHSHMALPGFATRWGHRLLHIHSPFFKIGYLEGVF